MGLINKIIAFFSIKGENVGMKVKAAEIREGKAFLHPLDNEKVTYVVPSKDISIILNDDLKEKDIKIIEHTKKDTDYSKITDKSNVPDDKVLKDNKERRERIEEFLKENKDNKKKSNNMNNKVNVEFDLEKFKKKSFTITLYPEEYEELVSSIKEFGYRREEVILACVNRANKRTVTTECNKIKKQHEQLKQEELDLRSGK